MRTHLWLATTAFGLASACGSAPPPVQSPAQSEDVTALQRRIQELETSLRAHEDTATTRFESLVQKLEALEIKLDETLRVAEAARRVPERPSIRPRPPRPSPSTVYSVPITGSPFEGGSRPLVTMVVAMEFSEPFSKRLLPTLDDLRKKYGKDLKVVYQHFIVHPQRGTAPARAVCAAGTLGQHRKMIDAVWVEYERWIQSRNATLLDESAMFSLASQLGLSRRKFKRAYDKTCPARIGNQESRFRRLGVTGVPGSFINGRYLSGARPASAFEVVIDEEIAKAKKAIKGGVKRRNYYKSIVKSGATQAKP